MTRANPMAILISCLLAAGILTILIFVVDSGSSSSEEIDHGLADAQGDLEVNQRSGANGETSSEQVNSVPSVDREVVGSSQVQLGFIDAVTHAPVQPRKLSRLLSDGTLEPLPIDGLGIVCHQPGLVSVAILAEFESHFPHLIAARANGNLSMSAEVEPSSEVTVHVRTEGNVEIGEGDVLVIEPHQAMVHGARTRSSLREYFLSDDESDAWHRLPEESVGYADRRVVTEVLSIIEAQAKSEASDPRASSILVNRVAVRFDGDRPLEDGPTFRLQLPVGALFRWSSNRSIGFDLSHDWQDVFLRERSLGPLDIPFPRGGLNDGWFRSPASGSNTLPLVLSESCRIRGILPPEARTSPAKPKISLYRLERPGIGGYTQLSASEVLCVTAGEDGSFSFVQISPDEYRVCASWHDSTGINVTSQIRRLSAGELWDMGVLTCTAGPEVKLDAFLETDRGDRISPEEMMVMYTGSASCLIPVQIVNHNFSDTLANFSDFVTVTVGSPVLIRGLPAGSWTALIPSMVSIEEYLPPKLKLLSRPAPVSFNLPADALVSMAIPVILSSPEIIIQIRVPQEFVAKSIRWYLASADDREWSTAGEAPISAGMDCQIKVEAPIGQYHFFLSEKCELNQSEHLGWYGRASIMVDEEFMEPIPVNMIPGLTIRGKLTSTRGVKVGGMSSSFDLVSVGSEADETRNQFISFCDEFGRFVINGVPEGAVIVSRISGDRFLVDRNLGEMLIRME